MKGGNISSKIIGKYFQNAYKTFSYHGKLTSLIGHLFYDQYILHSQIFASSLARVPLL